MQAVRERNISNLILAMNEPGHFNKQLLSSSHNFPVLSIRAKNRRYLHNFRSTMKKYQRLCVLIIAVISAICFIVYYYKYQNLYHVMDVLGSLAGPHQENKRNMSTLHGDSHEDEHRRMYRWIWMRMTDNIHVYSAYYDTENVKVFGTISFDKKKNDVLVKCLLWYAGDVMPDESTSTIILLDDKAGTKNVSYEGVIFKCHVLRANGQIPYGITLMDSSNIEKSSHRMLKVLPSQRSATPKNEFSVCVLPPLNGPYDNLKEAIQLLEMHKLVGFSRYIFYDFSSSDRMQHLLLEHAIELGFSVEVMHWNFPHQNMMDSKSLLLAKNDCLYRSMLYSKYTLISNLTNCVIPRDNRNIFEIVNSTVKALSRMPILTLAKGFFCDEYPNDIGKDYLQIKFNVLLKTNRHPTLHVSRRRSELFIPVGNIDYVTSSNEFVSILSDVDMVFKPIPETELLVHVYRSCQGLKIGNDNIRQPRFVYDGNALKYKDKLLRSALMAKIHYNF